MALALPPIPELFDTYSVKRRAAGGYSSGDFVTGAESTVTIKASIHPADGEELLNLPEGMRTRAGIVVHTKTQLITVNDETQRDPDRIVYQGEDWEVMRIEQYTTKTLPHYEALALRIERNRA